MPYWEKEPLSRIMDEGHLAFDDAGPLISPIKTFKIYRTNKLQLTLETLCGKEAIAQETLRRMNPASFYVKQEAVLKSIVAGGPVVALKGVIPENVHTSEHYTRDNYELRESAIIFAIECDLRNGGREAFTIDWIDNVKRYLWPQSVQNEANTIFKRVYGRQADALILMDDDGRYSSGMGALKLTIGGVELYLTINQAAEGTEQINPGYILYRGLPDEDTRRKIRTVLSFALGMFLVHLGHSTHTSEGVLTSFRAIRGYSMDMRAFDLHAQPPAWLGTKAHNELDIAKVSRFVSGLYAQYDELDFGNLSWGYWHAMTAPLHIKAVHFGAIIEALQRSYLKAHPKDFSEKVVGDEESWAKVKGNIAASIEGLGLTSGEKRLLRANVGRLNQTPRATLTDQVLEHLKLVLGEDEKRAWQRRHDAAHGNPMTPGKEREVVRDTHLLRVIFHRMVLKIVNGNDHYYDYATPPDDYFVIRPLQDPVPPEAKTAQPPV